MPLPNPIQAVGQIRAIYDFTNLTVRFAGTDITEYLREIGDAGGNTIEEAELQFVAGSRIAVGMNGGRVVPKTISLSMWADGVYLIESIMQTIGGGSPYVVTVPLRFKFALKPKDAGLAAITAKEASFDWAAVRIKEDGLSIPAGAASTTVVLQPIQPWKLQGISF